MPYNESQDAHLKKKRLSENSKSLEILPSSTAARMLFYCDACGHFISNDRYFEDRAARGDILLLHIDRGDFYVVIDDTIVNLKAGDTVIIDCYVAQIYGTRHYSDFTWAHVAGVLLEEIKNEVMEKNAVIMKNDENSAVKNLIYSLNEMYTSGNILPETDMSLMIAHALYSLLDKTVSMIVPETYSELIRKSLEYIKGHYMTPSLKVSEIADAVHLSVTHFRRLFGSEVGVAPHDYIIRLRISEAKQYLLTGGRTVKETAFLCGFNNESTFIYTFRNTVGISPGRWVDKINLN